MDSGRHDDFLALAAELGKGEINRFGCGSRAIVVRGVGNFHASQAAHQGLIFKDSLQSSLGDFRLIRCVCCIEFTTAKHVVHNRWNIVMICTCSEEGDKVFAHIFVGSSHIREMCGGFHFGKRRGKVQFREAVLGRDRLKKIIKRFHADSLEHRIPFFGRNWDVSHGLPFKVIRIKK